ncbi:AAA domain-containing protein, putative AbiEii toxin, Type IV TA system [Amphibacillus marinus]|uniref:AAA domain-containing protein, putative AbiEii toxin, Type IV TA system n=1 Tax=Amphibacillus marinus TaxID=872970 RepID=A0A1H8KZY7_9BACI|nr:AAA family ATPase [Amphibacillus marinus]SEN98463.1 AAA domain-containing protein, putative AbiEii toxin, Type IV TA system [Amphibacillus marinus]
MWIKWYGEVHNIILTKRYILGLKINNQDIKRISGHNIVANILSNNQLVEVTNQRDSRFSDIIAEDTSIYYLDYKQSTSILDFLDQDNLEELIDQYDENILTQELIDDLSYIVGKEYDEIILYEIEDGEEVIPYFKVKISDIYYDSLGMGMGEHFLFYIFWVFYKLKGSGIILIEEPETFISINSQQKLMDFIAQNTSKLGITVILASHSPYIIKRIKKENIIILNRYSNFVSVVKPSVARDSLVTLGLEIPKKGCIFVEDKVAEVYLKTILSAYCSYILREYNIEYVNGHAGITERLRFPNTAKFTYKLVGIYDGDMKEDIERIRDNINWGYAFLPEDTAIELEFKRCLRTNVQKFAAMIQVDLDELVQILSGIEGLDHHDWITELTDQLGKDLALIIEKLFVIWSEAEGNREKIENFAKNLQELC